MASVVLAGWDILKRKNAKKGKKGYGSDRERRNRQQRIQEPYYKI